MPRARLLGGLCAALVATCLGVAAAWQIYDTPWLWAPATAGLVIGGGTAWWGMRRRSALAASVVLTAAFVLTVVPVAAPQSFDTLPWGPVRGLLDALAAVVLGWKQLLTLTLPVGSYQAVLVPAYLVFLLSSFTVVALALAPSTAPTAPTAAPLPRGQKLVPLGAVALLAPVAFGTIFGASAVSAPLALGQVAVVAPRELALWGAAAVLGAMWVWWTSGAERRAALRRGRVSEQRGAGTGRATRGVLSGGVVLVALLAGSALAPVLDTGARQVPRDRVDPEVVLRERPSPLTAYRAWKRDDTLDTELFSVQSAGALPARLRIAVLDSYDGVDVDVSSDARGRFTRFPSAPTLSSTAEVTIRVGPGYSDIWVPTGELASVPSFGGPRGAELADTFFVNRDTGAAVVAPGGAATQGLSDGDTIRTDMSLRRDQPLEGSPRGGSDMDEERFPALVAWVRAQDQPATAAGLTELVQRLRERSYLSHSLSDAAGERLWLERLRASYGTRFETSAAGESAARIEQLFEQLNAQERLAGADAPAAMLVAGIGDDEQLSVASALVARSLGFDARVVLGVRLGDAEAGVPGVPACAATCTGANIAAWIEVRGAGAAWAPIDVTPQVAMPPTRLEDGERLPEFPSTPEHRDATEIDPPLGVGERNDASDTAEVPAGSPWIWAALRIAGLSLAALALVLLPLAYLPVMKRWRARVRKSRSDPELATLGAWEELVDQAKDMGVRVPDGASRSEVAALLDTQPARWAALTADRAVFAPAGVDTSDAEWAWAAVRADREIRAANMTRWQRVRSHYSLASYGVTWFSPGGRSKDQRADTTASRWGIQW